MENTFPQLKPDQVISGKLFLHQWYNNKGIIVCFYELCYNSQAEDDDKEFVFSEVLKLFYKIRIHHICRIFMENYRNKQNLTKKQKSLVEKS